MLYLINNTNYKSKFTFKEEIARWGFYIVILGIGISRIFFAVSGTIELNEGTFDWIFNSFVFSILAIVLTTFCISQYLMWKKFRYEFWLSIKLNLMVVICESLFYFLEILTEIFPNNQFINFILHSELVFSVRLIIQIVGFVYFKHSRDQLQGI